MKLPKVKLLRKLLYWAEERQRVFVKRQNNEPWPWTKDPIMQKHRFCCTYREDDRVTRWIREHWREPYADHPNLWFAMCIARQINWPDALEAIGFPEIWNPSKVIRILEKRMELHEKVFTSAYLLGGGCPKGTKKIPYIINNVLTPLHQQRHILWTPVNVDVNYLTTLQGVWNWILQFHGWGKFLAYEVVTDLRHTRYLNQAPDIMTWANLGPGAERGLNRLYERELNSHQRQEVLLEELLVITKWIQENKNPSILPTWEPRDSEHLFCEFDKMLRVTERELQGRVAGLERFHPPGIV